MSFSSSFRFANSLNQKCLKIFDYFPGGLQHRHSQRPLAHLGRLVFDHLSEPLVLDHGRGRDLFLRLHVAGRHRPQRHCLWGLLHDHGPHDEDRPRDEPHHRRHHPHRH